MMPTGRWALAAGNGLFTAMAIPRAQCARRVYRDAGRCAGATLSGAGRMARIAGRRGRQKKGRAMERVDGAGSGEYPLALSVYQDVSQHILSGKPYPVNAVLMIRANPVFETPQGARFAQALSKVPFVVSLAPVSGRKRSLRRPDSARVHVHGNVARRPGRRDGLPWRGGRRARRSIPSTTREMQAT